jgi:hypothetical protein
MKKAVQRQRGAKKVLIAAIAYQLMFSDTKVFENVYR